jgi:hypothetical protein
MVLDAIAVSGDKGENPGREQKHLSGKTGWRKRLFSLSKKDYPPENIKTTQT